MSGGDITIRAGGLEKPEVQALLQEHLRRMREVSPPESVHALDVDGLNQANVSFWTLWQDEQLAGCGALKELGAQHGEIKSMRTHDAFLRQGVAAAMLLHLMQVARIRGYRRVSLETGSMGYFSPARELYAKYGFSECAPFADYVPDPNSVFMTLALPASA